MLKRMEVAMSSTRHKTSRNRRSRLRELLLVIVPAVAFAAGFTATFIWAGRTDVEQQVIPSIWQKEAPTITSKLAAVAGLTMLWSFLGALCGLAVLSMIRGHVEPFGALVGLLVVYPALLGTAKSLLHIPTLDVSGLVVVAGFGGGLGGLAALIVVTIPLHLLTKSKSTGSQPGP